MKRPDAFNQAPQHTTIDTEMRDEIDEVRDDSIVVGMVLMVQSSQKIQLMGA